MPTQVVDLTNRPVGAGEAVAYTGTSAANTTAFPSGTKNVRVCLTTAGFVQVGVTPVAVANTSIYLPAGIIEYFSAAPGEKVAIVQESAAGTAYITPVG